MRELLRGVRAGVGAATLALGAAAAPAGLEPAPASQSAEAAERKSAGCVSCHTASDQKTMHAARSVVLGCSDCHGGDPTVTGAGAAGSPEYVQAMRRAHVLPRDEKLWKDSANPQRSYAAWLDEELAFVRFVNPGDLRAARLACGSCHDTSEDPIVHHVRKGMMTHGAMLYGAALYNNGVLPVKTPIVGESYGEDGTPQQVLNLPPPTADQVAQEGLLPFLVPFPRWELGQPGNPFRVFERGGRRRLEIGLPDREEEPGRPDKGLSPRGPGTLNRIDPLVLGAQKTRLLDPLLSLPGTNDQPGDYRASGCSACHVLYANDRERAHSGALAAAGNRGRSLTADPTIRRDQSGHPVRHEFTRAVPTSQCMSCHMHPGTNMLATYLGYTWWDNELDGEHLYPKAPLQRSAAEQDEIRRRNPEGAALKGLWGDPEFLAELAPTVNPKAQRTQFGDFHGHGWVFRKVYKQDRRGNLLDAEGQVVPWDDASKFAEDGRAVHLKDIHLERGMHCVDCHFKQDNHGDGNLYGEPRAAIEIDCVDCHGTIRGPAPIYDGRPTGPAASTASRALGDLKTPWREPRFEEVERDGRSVIVQRSVVEKGVEWVLKQVVDTVTPGSPDYSEKSRLAKTMQKDGTTWGDAAGSAGQLAHANERMTCYACHSAWTTNCFGCHLSMKANSKQPMLHNEGGDSRNWTSYNFQTLRDDGYFLGKNGALRGGEGDDALADRIAPVRSSCSILVSSQNQNREWIYSQQQTVSGGGYSGTAFSTYVPHTVRGKETKTCTDCHVAAAGDNNAWMASLLLHGTGLTNFIGRYAYVGEEKHGFEAVVVSERDEPQAVIGSRLHQLAYPDQYAQHERRGRALKEAYHHSGEVQSLQLQGEYLFAAQGRGGLRIYDVAQIDHKGFSERTVSAPVSPLGQRLYAKTRDAAWVALATTQTIDPWRPVVDPRPENLERPVHPIFGYAFVADREEGLVVVEMRPEAKGAHTLLDGEPRNNFVRRVATWNEGGVLAGASFLTLAGTNAYVATPRGIVVLDLGDPLRPRLLAELTTGLREPRSIAIQFRYAFVTDADGLKVVDITLPQAPRLVAGALVPLADAHHLYLARTYAYVAAGAQGLAIIDVEAPERPRLDQLFSAGGAIDDAHDVKVGMTNGSAFAYVADGRNGLRVVQIVSANDTPGAYGFSPRPTPLLIATYRTHGPAVALSRGLDRDRAVDETGHQLAVFGRKGARPFDLAEQRRMYLRDGQLFTVTDAPPGPPRVPPTARR